MNKIIKVLAGISTLAVLSIITVNVISRKPTKVDHPLQKSVYRVMNANKGSTGTGFAIQDGRGRRFIVTNNHVCTLNGMKLSAYVFVEREGEENQLKVVGHPVLAAPELDLCIIRAPGIAEPLVLSDREVKRGEHLVTIGHPEGGPLAIAVGQLISAEEEVVLPVAPAVCGMPGLMSGNCSASFALGLMSGPAVGGQSGSPVFDTNSKVIGVVAATDGDYSTAFIPVKNLIKVVNFLEYYLE